MDARRTDDGPGAGDGTMPWTGADMIDAAPGCWGIDGDPADCRVITSTAAGERCPIVVHVPTGRVSTEAGDGGRWHLDGTAY